MMGGGGCQPFNPHYQLTLPMTVSLDIRCPCMSVLPFPVIMIVSYTLVSEESHFCSTKSSATLKESPPLEETHGPRGLAILSDEKHVNSENSHLSHVGLFTTIILYLFDQLF
jgi:hypothetical protein